MTVFEFPNGPHQTCPCGSVWFTTAIRLDADGGIASYSTPVTCTECGEKYTPNLTLDFWREDT